MSLTWTGPAVLAGAIAYVFHRNHPTGASDAEPKPVVSTTSFAIMIFAIYVLGALPRNRFFPTWWYRDNIFKAMYRYLYCSEAVGYNVLKRFMHAPQPYPHSDFRGGIRTLTEIRAVGEQDPAKLSSAAVAMLGENLQRWRPPCLDELDANGSDPALRRGAQQPNPRSAAAVAAAALEKLKKSSRDTAAMEKQDVPRMFAMRGGLPVDVQKLKYRKSDRHVLVFPIPIFADNYSYLIFSCRTKKCCLVDPADPIAAMRCILYLKKHLFGDERTETEIKITDVLTTHKHWDHAGGNKDLYEYAKGEENREKAERNENICAIELNIYGPAEESTHFANKSVVDADVFTVCDGAVRVDVLAAPGHTHGSLLYVISDAQAAKCNELESNVITVKNRLAVFTGDALFSCGLGAPFETNSVAQIKKTRNSFMDSSVMQRHPITGEAVAPEDVLLYVGHEYTERLAEEMCTLTTRLMNTPAAQADADSDAHSAGAKRYLSNLTTNLRDVKIMRAQTDGLDDARQEGDDLVDANKANLTAEEKERQRRLRHRIPLCTVPSTLALEQKVNPLLTLRAEALDEIPLLDGALDAKAMEKTIYLSLDRVSN